MVTAVRQVEITGTHQGQYDVWTSTARFRVVAAGRRWGKTRLGAALCIDAALRGRRSWWVAPSFPIASIGWRQIRLLASQIGGQVREMDRLARLPSGGWVQVKSADNPDSLRGEGLDFVALDECAFMPEAAWTQALRPSLSDRLGKAMFISTPKGRNWFWQAWVRGQDAAQTEWQSWQKPTADNPFIAASEIAAARESLPQRVFEQEYLASFISDSGGVFRRVAEAAIATPQDKATEGHEYLIGVDWAKHEDWTVLSVLDVTSREIVYVDRFNQIDYTLQLARLKALYDRFRPQTMVIERNTEEVLIEQLQRERYRVTPFTTTNASKAQAVDALSVAFEQSQLRIIPDPVLIAELQAYEMERLPSGMLRYSAPEGMHDDCVMSAMFAWYGYAYGQPPKATKAPSNPFW